VTTEMCAGVNFGIGGGVGGGGIVGHPWCNRMPGCCMTVGYDIFLPIALHKALLFFCVFLLGNKDLCCSRE